MEFYTDPPPDRPPPTAAPVFHPATALWPLMDVDGAEFGELPGGHRRLYGEATP